MVLTVNKKDIIIDKIFVNKNYKNAFSMGSKVKIWFNNLTFSDYVFLENMSSDIYSSCGLDGFEKSFSDYKKNILFVNKTGNNKYVLNFYVGSFINTLEKDRCLINYDIRHELNWKTYGSILEKLIHKEGRKQKISDLLNDN